MAAEELTPEQIDESASSMAWTLNDELWETAPEHRRKFWREMVVAHVKAVMLPQAEKRAALQKLHDRIALEGLT